MLFGRSQYSATCQQLVFPTCGHSRRWRESLTAPEHSLDLCLVPVMLVYVCRSILELSWSLWQGHVWALWKHCSAMTSLVSTRISLWLLPPIHTEKRSSCYSLCKFPAHQTTTTGWIEHIRKRFVSLTFRIVFLVPQAGLKVFDGFVLVPAGKVWRSCPRWKHYCHARFLSGKWSYLLGARCCFWNSFQCVLDRSSRFLDPNRIYLLRFVLP